MSFTAYTIIIYFDIFFSFKKESMASQSFGDSYMLFKLKELFIIQFIVSPSIHNIVSS